jgi:hypothetical protein
VAHFLRAPLLPSAARFWYRAFEEDASNFLQLPPAVMHVLSQASRNIVEALYHWHPAAWDPDAKLQDQLARLPAALHAAACHWHGQAHASSGDAQLQITPDLHVPEETSMLERVAAAIPQLSGVRAIKLNLYNVKEYGDAQMEALQSLLTAIQHSPQKLAAQVFMCELWSGDAATSWRPERLVSVLQSAGSALASLGVQPNLRVDGKSSQVSSFKVLCCNAVSLSWGCLIIASMLWCRTRCKLRAGQGAS